MLSDCSQIFVYLKGFDLSRNGYTLAFLCDFSRNMSTR